MKKSDAFFLMSAIYFAQVVSDEVALVFGVVALAVGFLISFKSGE